MLNVPEHEVISMNGRLAGPDYSLNTPVRAENEAEWQDCLGDDSETQESALARHEELLRSKGAIVQCVDRPEWSRAPHCDRAPADGQSVHTQEAVVHYGISRERVRQIEARALQKLKKAMEARKIDNGLQHHHAMVDYHVSAQPG